MADLFSKSTLGLARGQQYRPLGQPTPERNVLEDEGIRFLQRAEGMARRVFARHALEEKNFKDRSFVSATSIAQQSFDFELKRELSRYYTSDGQDVNPPTDYNRDLGFGVSFTGADLTDTEGKRRTFVESVKHFHEKFAEGRKAKSPSVRAETAAALKMREGELRALVGAQKYQDGRQGSILSNNLNAVVRSYKEVLAKEKGFNPDTFALHVESMLDNAQSSSNLLDAGAVNTAVRISLGDMIAVGITEAHSNRDNMLALRYLADSPLRDTEMVRKSISGLSGKDLAYLERYRKKARLKGMKKFGINDRPPKNRAQFFEWAISQQSEKRKGDLQARAIEAFASQTNQVRNELSSRIQGLQFAAFSPQIRDAGFRQAIRQSAQKALADVNRVYPRDLYPKENIENVAATLVGAQAVEIRNMFDYVPTDRLTQYAMGASGQISNSIMAQLPKDEFTMALPVQRKVYQSLMSFAQNETKARQADPYGALKRISKELREVDNRLSVSDYPTAADKFKDQSVLRQRVEKKAAQLGILPSFLSGNDLLSLRSLSKMQNKAELGKVVEQIREKYGESTFYDYIVPEMGKDEFIGPMALGYSLIPSKEVSNMVLEANINAASNRKFLKDSDSQEKAKIFKTFGEDLFYIWDLFDRPEYGEKYMDHLDGYIMDRLGNGATGQRAMASMRKAISNLAMQHLVTGTQTDGHTATIKAISTVMSGIGEKGEFKGKRTIFPATMTLNEPRMELLENVVYNQNFLTEQVYPHIVPNPPIVEKAKLEGVNPASLLHRYFTDDDIMRWGFSWEGIVPYIENPLFPDLRSAIPNKEGSAFILPYGELPHLIVNPRYN